MYVTTQYWSGYFPILSKISTISQRGKISRPRFTSVICPTQYQRQALRIQVTYQYLHVQRLQENVPKHFFTRVVRTPKFFLHYSNNGCWLSCPVLVDRAELKVIFEACVIFLTILDKFPNILRFTRSRPAFRSGIVIAFCFCRGRWRVSNVK